MVRENRRKQKKRKGFLAKEKQPCKKWQLAQMPFAKKFGCAEICQHDKTKWINVYFGRFQHSFGNCSLCGNHAVKITKKIRLKFYFCRVYLFEKTF